MAEEETVETPETTVPETPETETTVPDTAEEKPVEEEKPAKRRGRKRKTAEVEADTAEVTAEQKEEKPAKVVKKAPTASAQGQVIFGTYRVYDTYMKTSNSRLVTGNFKVVTRVNGLLEVQYVKPGFGVVRGYLEQ